MLSKTLSKRELSNNKIHANIAALSLIAEQNGLRLNRPREFKICKAVLKQSINQN